MNTYKTASSIALAACLGWSLPVLAQDAPALGQPNAAPQSPALPAEVQLQQMREDMARMMQRMNALENELAAAKAQSQVQAEAQERTAAMGHAAIASAAAKRVAEAVAAERETKVRFKGAPEFKGHDGWSFKPRGRLQYDAGFTNVPASTGRPDGFGSEARRARLGVAGDMPGGFGYKFELDFAGSDLTVTDAFLSYKTGSAKIMLGQLNNFQSLNELTSSVHTSFIERSAFTDAFGFERRVGAAVEFKTDDVLVQTGVFTDNMDDLSNQNIGVDGRIVAMPKVGNTQLHFGASAHFADLEAGSTVRYRQRPLVHFTSERFINTGNIGADSEFGLGLEGAVIAGPFHLASEAYWQKVNRSGSFSDPTFFGGSIEAGYFLTKGDTRGYKGGKFDRVKPKNPVDKGGIGSVQFNLRYDHLDLNDAGIIGGKQDGYMASFIWKPTAYMLLLANYGKLDYTDAVYAEIPSGNRNYGVDVFGVRAQVDF